MKKTICELFAGVGGFRLGFEKSSQDWETVWFSQWEPGKKQQWAHDCYVKHFGDINSQTNIDIEKVDKERIPNHNLLVGGFPCQDYSVARPLPDSTGIQGKKGVLWWQIRDVLEIKRPPFVLLENVDRLLKSPASQRGRDFGVMLACFASLNYQVEWRVINAAEYGAGQRRRRVFIFAFHADTQFTKQSDLNDEFDYLVNEGYFSTIFPIVSAEKSATTTLSYEDVHQVSESFAFNFENAGFMKDGVIYTVHTRPKKETPIPLSDMLEQNVPQSYYLGDDLDKWVYLKGAKRIERRSKGGHAYVFSEGGISFPDSLELPARTMLTSESSLNRSTHVIQDPETMKLRKLTPVETERIQGFEDNWTNTGMPEKMRYFCMGNALVVPLVTRMGKELIKIFDRENESGVNNN